MRRALLSFGLASKISVVMVYSKFNLKFNKSRVVKKLTTHFNNVYIDSYFFTILDTYNFIVYDTEMCYNKLKYFLGGVYLC